ncbi:MAG: hypothetical protein GY866_09845, partial [Proteobacteria bacterium]|nr:hypothetical protein [Pseudomonadota bacterium]
MVHSIDKKRGETVAVFSNECRRQLDSLESELKGLSSLSDPEGMAEMVGSASRLFFSIRDKAVSMNLDAIEGVANSAENFLELHCAEPKELTALHIDLLKRTCRLTRGLLENLESESKNGFEEEVDALIRQLEQGPGADPTESSDRPSTLG